MGVGQLQFLSCLTVLRPFDSVARRARRHVELRKQMTKTTTAAVVHPPFGFRSEFPTPEPREAARFLNDELHPQHSKWVQEAVAIAAGQLR
jgi:hypothetical protein